MYQTDISGASPEDALAGVGGSWYMNRGQCVTTAFYLTPDDKSNILAGYNPANERPKTIWNAFGLF